MSFFKRLFENIGSSGSVDKVGYWVYVSCNKCQEPLKVRVNLHHDLSIDYDGPHGQSYFSRKTIVGSLGCFQRIEIELTFNQKRKLINREISGGTFIEKSEYLAVENQ